MKDIIPIDELFDNLIDTKTDEEYEDPYEIMGGDLEDDRYTYDGKFVSIVEHEGGEGKGESAHVVIKIGDTFYRADYSYYSYDGFNYDDSEFRKVEKKEKTINVYE